MAINKTSFLNTIKSNIPKLGGSITYLPKGLSTVGASAAAKNAALASDLAATKLKTKLTLEGVKAGAQRLSNSVAPVVKKAPSVIKSIATKTIPTGAGLAAVGAAAGYGAYRIMKAGKEARTAIDEQVKAQEAGSRMATEATKRLIEQRKKKFVPTKEAGTLTPELRQTLMKEAPETLRPPVRQRFSSQEAYVEAIRKFNKNKNWASDK